MDGLLIVDKPQGWTSHDVVALVRAHTRVRKVGHAGSLDPLATGVLVILVGRATKLAGQWLGADKEYVATVSLGTSTDTGDADGRILEQRSVAGALTRHHVEEVLRGFTGTITQTPPMVSALKHRGRPLYWWARHGKTVERAARQVQIHTMALVQLEPLHLTLRIVCSKGTYVRTLAEEIAEALGTVGHLSALQRTRVGPCTLAQAVSAAWIRLSDPATIHTRLLPMALPTAPALMAAAASP